MKEFFKKVNAAEIIKVDANCDTEPSIRLYCTQHQESWNLQVRAKLRLKNYSHSKQGMVGTARLLREDLELLRNAIDEALTD